MGISGAVRQRGRSSAGSRRVRTALPVLALCLVAGCASSSADAGGDSAGASDSPSGSESALPEPTPAEDVVEIEVGNGPVGLTVDAADRVWVANALGGTVSRLGSDGADGVDLERKVGQVPLRLAATSSGVWSTTFSGGSLLRVDPDNARVLDRIRVGEEPEGLTVVGEDVWVVLQSARALVRVETGSGEVVERHDAGLGPRLVTQGNGYLWVSDYVDGEVLRLNPETGERRSTRSLCDGPQGMVVDTEPESGLLWVACTGSDEVVGVDTDSLDVEARLPVPGDPDGVAVDESGRVLVALQDGPSLAVLDPRERVVTSLLGVGDHPPLFDQANIDVVARGDRALLTSYLSDSVYDVALPES